MLKLMLFNPPPLPLILCPHYPHPSPNPLVISLTPSFQWWWSSIFSDGSRAPTLSGTTVILPAGLLQAASVVGCCEENRLDPEVNPMCGKCAPGNYEWQGRCQECDGVNGGLMTLFFVASLACVLLFHLVSQSISGHSKIFMSVLPLF